MHSHSQVRVPRGSCPHFTVSYLRLPQPGGPGPCIYIPQEQGGPVLLEFLLSNSTALYVCESAFNVLLSDWCSGIRTRRFNMKLEL
jgi:hypothetical protein